MAGVKTILTALFATFAAFYVLVLKDILALDGIYPKRVVEAIGNENCEIVKGLEACEKFVIHEPTGIVYLACSSPRNRSLWLPYFGLLDPKGSGGDHIMQYNPETKVIKRMQFAGLEPNKFSSHGMDVVTSSKNPNELFFYLVNHRAPYNGNPKKVGADSVIQVFRTTSPSVGGKSSERLIWVKTYNSKHIHTPNDVVGSADGNSFYFTNDHSKPVGFGRSLEVPLSRAVTSVGYCHETKGCKIAAPDLVAANGIASNGNGTIYVASSSGYVQVFEEQKDHSLVEGDTIYTGIMLDNLSLDSDGHLYAGGFPRPRSFIKSVSGADVLAPSIAIKFSKDIENFIGHKYRIETIFQNDGSLMTSATSVAFDAQRRLLYLHGIVAPHMLVCQL